MIFFPTAAAAERAGFRPCLRCRPETAPGSPAWHGTATTVARGMRLIDEGFLDRGSVRALADQLGIGPRHMLRLFLRHAGATPSELASTRRVQAAKRLIDETTMPLAAIAFAAGFAASDASTTRSSRPTAEHPPQCADRSRPPPASRPSRCPCGAAPAQAASLLVENSPACEQDHKLEQHPPPYNQNENSTVPVAHSTEARRCA